MVSIHRIRECPDVSERLWGSYHGWENRKIEPKVRKGCCEAIFATWQRQCTHTLSSCGCMRKTSLQSSQSAFYLEQSWCSQGSRVIEELLALGGSEKGIFSLSMHPLGQSSLDSVCLKKEDMNLGRRWETVWYRRWRGLRNRDDLNSLYTYMKLPKNKNKKLWKYSRMNKNMPLLWDKRHIV